MKKLDPADLLGLEAYARERAAFRARVLAHKKARSVHVGAHVTLLFEDRLTIQYQVQEMLRIERIFEAAGIAEELSAYNPLVPDGDNLKATMLIEYPDPAQRAERLVALRGIEHHVALRVGASAPLRGVADEDLPRSNDTKTAAVHFLRFNLDATRVAACKRGDAMRVVIDHPAYGADVALSPASIAALAADLD